MRKTNNNKWTRAMYLNCAFGPQGQKFLHEMPRISTLSPVYGLWSNGVVFGHNKRVYGKL